MKEHLLVLSVSISSNSVSVFGPVDAEDKLGRHEVAQVLHAVRGRVYVVVTTFSVVAEAVSVLHPQVQSLNWQQANKQSHLENALLKSS